MFNADNKDIKTTSVKLLRCIYVSFEQILQIFLLFLLLTLNRLMFAGFPWPYVHQ